MKINSEHLYKYINELATNEKVKFNVYYDDQYVTQIYWNGESFEWDSGTFNSQAFFNPLYDFLVIKEDKKIEKLKEPTPSMSTYDYVKDIKHKLDELIDEINSINKKVK